MASGRPLAQKLLAAGERVVGVPPKLSSRVRVLSSFAGNARKNDALDATFTALAACETIGWARSIPRMVRRHAETYSHERREDLVCERTRALNRLHVLLCGTSSPILSGSSFLPMPPPNCCAAPGPSIHGPGPSTASLRALCETCALLTGA